MAGPVSVDGLISGLDTKSIIEQLVALQASRVARIQAKQADETEKVTLFQALQGNYLNIRTAASSLTSPTLFNQRSVTSSDTSILTATASTTAVPGAHQITVVQLATAHQFLSNRFIDKTSSTGVTGDLKITVGEGATAVTTTISLSSSNNTLQGIQDAINGSGAKVKASIVQADGSLRPFKLLITAKDPGTVGKLSITFNNASFLSTVTDEEAGLGKGTDTATTDDSDGTTFAFKTARPNPGSAVTVKLGPNLGAATTIQQQLASPSVTTITQGTGGTLTGGTTFYYKVTALDASGETIASSVASATTSGDFSNVDRSLTVNWGAVTGATDYKVYFSQDPNNFSQNSLVGSTGGATNITHTSPIGSAGSPPATATQGYAIDFETGTVKFNKAQTDKVFLTYQHGGLLFTESQAVRDAIIKLGSGDSTTTVTKNSNTVTDLIEGVTLDLKKADANSTVIVDVKRSTLGVTSSVQGLVNAINETEAFIQENSFFDAETNTSGPLFSNSNLLLTRSRVNAILTGFVRSVAPGKIRSLAEAGISLSADTGRYTFDSGKFNSLLSSDPDSLRDLFASVATATDSDVEALAFSANTKTSSSLGYLVQITQAATRAEDVGAQDISAGLAQAESLTITSGGLTAVVSLASGTSGPNAAAAINTSLQNAGITDVSASFNPSTGKLTLIHASYGLKHSFKVKSDVASGTTRSTGLGSAVANAEVTFIGQDVKGTIGGEAATGEGQTLTGNSGNANTDGLQIRVTITPAQLTAQGASQGIVTVSRGIATQLDELLTFLTDESQEGPIQAAINESNSRITDFQAQIDLVTARIEREQARLSEEFTRLEQALGTLQTTSQFLTRQLAQINANASNFGASRR